MKDRETTRSGEALPDSGADGSGVEVDDDSRPLDWVHESPVHGAREISYYEQNKFLEKNRWQKTTHTVIWLTDRDPLAIAAEVRDPQLVEAFVNAYEMGRKAERREALKGAK